MTVLRRFALVPAGTVLALSFGRADTLAQFVEKITRAPLMEDPGTRFRYSEGTTVLRARFKTLVDKALVN